MAREVEVVYAIFIPAVLSNISIDIVEDYAEFRLCWADFSCWKESGLLRPGMQFDGIRAVN
jgi:hypothetical protein